jgi:mono/diheme cytochrome c family protein
MNRWFLCLGLMSFAGPAVAAEPTDGSAERGRDAVRGRPALNPPIASHDAYANVWKQWGVADKPADLPKAIRERYGLHPAPYPNGDLPMGLHPAEGLFFKGVVNDCLLCHAGTVAGQTIVGLANATLDIEGLFTDLITANGGTRAGVPVTFSHVRGTIDPTSSFTLLLSHRDADLNFREQREFDYFDGICSDPPAWWLLKKKKTRDWTGGIDSQATRLDMVTLLSPFNSGTFIKKQAGVFADIHAFVMSVEPPRYPFRIDTARAARGAAVFAETCASCHGTYGKQWKYPNKIVPLDKIGTDPALAEGLSKRNIAHFNSTWFAQEKGPDGKPYTLADTRGYQAPPLDGVWATAPYFHNASVPTLYHVLNSKARPKVFTRSYRSEKEDYDNEKVGLKVTPLTAPPGAKAPGYERRKVYDTSIPGRGNGGHTFGDDLTEDERLAVIEYLKTL